MLFEGVRLLRGWLQVQLSDVAKLAKDCAEGCYLIEHRPAGCGPGFVDFLDFLRGQGGRHDPVGPPVPFFRPSRISSPQDRGQRCPEVSVKLG